MYYAIQFNNRTILFMHQDRNKVEEWVYTYYPDKKGVDIVVSLDHFDDLDKSAIELIKILQDKLSRRNMQIRDVKRELERYRKDHERLCQYLVNKGLFQEARAFEGF